MMDDGKRLARNGISRGVLTLIDDEGKMQRVQVSILDGELADDVERFQNYGFTSVPEAGAEATVVFIGGDRGHPVVVVADDRRVRMAGLEPGEVAVYHRNGDFIHLKNGNVMEVSTKQLTIKAADSMTIDTKQLTVTASTGILVKTPSLASQNTGGGAMAASVTGSITTTQGDIVADGISLKIHTHPGDSGGTTGAPNG